MRLLIACDDSGSIKELICNKNTNTSVQTAPQPFHVGTHLPEGFDSRVEIIKMVGTQQLLVARANGSIHLIKLKRVDRDVSETDPAKEPIFQVSELHEASTVGGLFDEARLLSIHKSSKKRSRPRDGFVALELVPQTSNRIFSATKSGLVHVLSIENGELKLVSSNSVKAPLEFAQVYDLAAAQKTNSKHRASSQLTFAYGGEENLVKIAHFTSGYKTVKQIWEAKNVSNDRLDLKVPVWPTKLKFLEPASAGADEGKVNFQFVTMNRLGFFRQYRTLTGRKPMLSKALLPKNEFATQLQAINSDVTPAGNIRSSSFDNLQFITSDLKKNVFSFTAASGPLGKYGNGDITGYASFLNIQKNYLLQGGLDRYVRVFDPESRAMICKCYTGSKISSVVMVEEEEIEVPQLKENKKRKPKHGDDKAEAEEDEELWSTLESSAKKLKKN
ncbi:LAQU0S02e10550g1_1 [Lachancea quebecensis]|uniref:Ribosome biogenesis protein NSA1 n=1 Tax=Lachancea quebecensis TaxID=1654605 RepID=A0A0P1KP04_9SACH|nr:LAQU0S02e10550g1_1 [Lachancea quebecensis]